MSGHRLSWPSQSPATQRFTAQYRQVSMKGAEMDYPALPMLEQLLQPPWSSGECCSGCAVSMPSYACDPSWPC